MFIISFFLQLICLLFGLQNSSLDALPSLLKQAPTVRVHIFIHGTYLPGLIFLDPKATFKHKIDPNGPYFQALEVARNKGLLSHTHVMLENGLQEITPEMITQWRQSRLPNTLKYKAAIHVISAYDQFVDKKNTTNLYFTYGWLGVLDDEYRQQEADRLYKTLDELHEKFKKQYPGNTIEFILHGHSHGGNVILYLAKYEHIYKKHVPVTWACLYATPVQPETAQYCTDPLFKNVYIVYSRGDFVQNNDRFSTKTKKSCRTFTELISPAKTENNIYQLCARAHDKDTAFGHQAMFCFDSYYQLARVHRYSKKHQQVVATLSPLPLVTFAPLIMQLLPKIFTEKTICSANMCAEIPANDRCFFAISGDHAYAQSENIIPRLTEIKKIIKNNR